MTRNLDTVRTGCALLVLRVRTQIYFTKPSVWCCPSKKAALFVVQYLFLGKRGTGVKDTGVSETPRGADLFRSRAKHTKNDQFREETHTGCVEFAVRSTERHPSERLARTFDCSIGRDVHTHTLFDAQARLQEMLFHSPIVSVSCNCASQRRRCTLAEKASLVETRGKPTFRSC